MHFLPTRFQVRWTLTAERRTDGRATFSCTVETTMPTPLRLAATLIGTPHFVRKHVKEETPPTSTPNWRNRTEPHWRPTVHRWVAATD
jgi:hypothetical protein